MNTESKRRTFSIELRTKKNLSIHLPKGVDEEVTIEGNLGDFVDIKFVESAMLEIHCTEGTLLVDLSQANWNKLCQKGA